MSPFQLIACYWNPRAEVEYVFKGMSQTMSSNCTINTLFINAASKIIDFIFSKNLEASNSQLESTVWAPLKVPHLTHALICLIP